jgi:hypothetical protein
MPFHIVKYKRGWRVIDDKGSGDHRHKFVEFRNAPGTQGRTLDLATALKIKLHKFVATVPEPGGFRTPGGKN